ncbi:MAG TPA: PilZ domain-containing protein [Amphiplicatus sp.]|nr:PilZ domain-containing protein [Amphiplicatus sp.]
MAKDKDRLSQRLSAIKTASAVQFDGPIGSRGSRDKRGAARQSVFRFARLILPDRSIVKCVIKDISSTGARVAIEGNFAIPKHVVLKIDQIGTTKEADVVWQDETEIGLNFSAPPA